MENSAIMILLFSSLFFYLRLYSPFAIAFISKHTHAKVVVKVKAKLQVYFGEKQEAHAMLSLPERLICHVAERKEQARQADTKCCF